VPGGLGVNGWWGSVVPAGPGVQGGGSGVPGGGAWTRSGGGAWTGSDNDAWTRSDSGGRAAIGEIGSPSASLGDGSHQPDQSASPWPLPFPAG
jgi:hypothetical protein